MRGNSLKIHSWIWAVCGLIVPLSSLFGAAKYEPPDGSIYYGYSASGYWSDSQMKSTLDRIHNNVSDKPFLLYSFFVHAKEKGRWNGWYWRENGPDGQPVHGSGAYLERVRDNGYVPVIAWTWMDWRDHSQSPSLKGLLRGEYDWYLDEWITGLKEFGTPVFIRLSHEMDGGWYPYSEGFPRSTVTAEDYVRYWQYVVDRFRAAGVDNVAWVWCVSGSRQGKRDWIDYYPGDGYVDWIAADIYSNRPGSTTLHELRNAIGRDKPIMIPEGGTEDLLTAYNPDYPGNKEWVRDFYNTILNDMDNQVKAVCWFHWNEHSYVDRDPEQVPVYRNFVERDAFINVLHENDTLEESPDSVTPQIEVIDFVRFAAIGDTQTITARFVGFAGETAAKWSIEEGDLQGLDINFDNDRARIVARKSGQYTVKVQAWNKRSQFASETVKVTVGDDAEEPAENPQSNSEDDQSGSGKVSIPASLELKADGEPFTVIATMRGFAPKNGTKWSLLYGDPQGLKIEYAGAEGTLTPFKPGTYSIKMEGWDANAFDSDTMQVVITAPGSGSTSDSADLGVPEELSLIAGGQSKTVEIDLSGFSGKTYVECQLKAGDAEGLVIVDNFSTATLKALKPGIYTVKVQAWDPANYKSADIEVAVVQNESTSAPQPAIVVPDWIQIVLDGSEYQLDATVVGFSPKGFKWSIQAGSPAGLSLENDGLQAYLRGWVEGDYVVKVEAWKDEIHVSRHIRMTINR